MSWDQIHNADQDRLYSLLSSGAVTSLEVEAYREAESREEFEDLVTTKEELAAYAEYEQRYRQSRS